MSSSKEYLHFILEQLSDLEAFSYKFGSIGGITDELYSDHKRKY